MNFRTQSSWEIKDPFYKAFEDPKNPCFMWRAVEMTMSVYYYHVHIKPDPDELGSVSTDILMGDIDDALEALRSYPRSSLFLQTPTWLNNGEPGLYRVTALYKSADPVIKPYIAEIANGTMYVLAFDNDSGKIDPKTVEKITIWTTRK